MSRIEADATVTISGIEANVSVRANVAIEDGQATILGEPEVRFNEEWRSAYQWDLGAYDIDTVENAIYDEALEGL